MHGFRGYLFWGMLFATVFGQAAFGQDEAKEGVPPVVDSRATAPADAPGTRQPVKYVDFLAESGGVELSRMTETRTREPDSAAWFDNDHLDLNLWLTFSDKEDLPNRLMVRIADLEPIVDDTGKDLLSEFRREHAHLLNEDVYGFGFEMTRGKMGPRVLVRVDAPNRRATALKSIKGKAIISEPSYSKLRFDKLRERSGKALEHDKLKSIEIVPSIEARRGKTIVRLAFADGRRQVVDAILMVGEEMILASGEEDDRNSMLRVFDGNHLDDAMLTIILAEPMNPRTLSFEFKDISLE